MDLVYNRLTDFSLSDPTHAALHDAYVAGAAVVTPHPRAHALYADKRNLITLGNDALLASWGVSDEDRLILQAAIPHTELVTADHAQALWARRRQLFFKPVAGYGAKPPTAATSSRAASGAISSPAALWLRRWCRPASARWTSMVWPPA
ncbi:hypothetical protein LP415_12415 [Polaromonas sp. P1(28)-8]|nr:hypothetical protein LP415_12415 [Polaromonas sp. P1(28)-8]